MEVVRARCLRQLDFRGLPGMASNLAKIEHQRYIMLPVLPLQECTCNILESCPRSTNTCVPDTDSTAKQQPSRLAKHGGARGDAVRQQVWTRYYFKFLLAKLANLAYEKPHRGIIGLVLLDEHGLGRYESILCYSLSETCVFATNGSGR